MTRSNNEHVVQPWCARLFESQYAQKTLNEIVSTFIFFVIMAYCGIPCKTCNGRSFSIASLSSLVFSERYVPIPVPTTGARENITIDTRY